MRRGPSDVCLVCLAGGARMLREALALFRKAQSECVALDRQGRWLTAFEVLPPSAPLASCVKHWRQNADSACAKLSIGLRLAHVALYVIASEDREAAEREVAAAWGTLLASYHDTSISAEEGAAALSGWFVMPCACAPPYAARLTRPACAACRTALQHPSAVCVRDLRRGLAHRCQPYPPSSVQWLGQTSARGCLLSTMYSWVRTCGCGEKGAAIAHRPVCARVPLSRSYGDRDAGVRESHGLGAGGTTRVKSCCPCGCVGSEWPTRIDSRRPTGFRLFTATCPCIRGGPPVLATADRTRPPQPAAQHTRCSCCGAHAAWESRGHPPGFSCPQ